MKTTQKPLIAAVTAAVMLSGCGAYTRIAQAPGEAAEAQAAAQQHGTSQLQRQQGAVRHHAEPWVSFDMVPRAPAKPKIARALDCDVTFAADSPMPLADAIRALGQPCGLNLRVTSDAWSYLSGFSGGMAVGQAGPQGGLDAPPSPGAPLLLASQVGPAALPAQHPQIASAARQYRPPQMVPPIRWQSRPLSGLMDAVAASLGLTWSHRDGTIQIQHLDTKTFPLITLASTTKFRSNVVSGTTLTQGSSSTGNSSGASNSPEGKTTQETTIELEASLAEDLQASIRTALSEHGRFAFSRSTSTVTVTDTPEALSRVEALIAQVNESMGRQVMLYVTVAMVTLNDSDSLGVNWNAVFSTLNGSYGISLGSPFSAVAGAPSAGFSILDTATGRAGQFQGSNAVLSALSQQGTVSIYKQRNVTTANMQPTPIDISDEEQYICGRSNTPVAQVGATEGVDLCTVLTGFNLEMLPFIIDPTQLMLQFGMRMSPPAEIRTLPGDPDRPVQSAKVNRQSFQQRVRLRSNQTLVLTDFQERSDDSRLAGMGGMSPAWPITGGGSRRGGKTVIVIMVTPFIESGAPFSTTPSI